MKIRTPHFFVYLTVFINQITVSLQGDAERFLLKHLFSDYEALERPAKNDSDALEVQFGLTLQQIIDVDEKYQVINSNIWLNILWHDYRLSWDPKDYANITVINLPITKIWRPDVLMYNSADETFDATFPVNAVIAYDGQVKWVPPGMFKSTCNINIQWFPFDDQECELKFGSWTYDGTKLNLTLMATSGDISAFIKNGEWTLLGVPATRDVMYYECCPNMPFPSVTYFIQIRRRRMYFVTNVFVPSQIISTLSISSFLMPVDSGEKVGFGMPAIRNVKQYEPDIHIPWIDVAFTIEIRRRALYYTFNLIVPSVMLSSITLLTFTLPVESGEKISLGVTILLSLTVFLLLVAETMPPTSDAIPLIGIYFACTMMMCSLSVIFTVLVLNFHSRRPETHEMPKWVKKGICVWLAWMLRMERPGHDLSRSAIMAARKKSAIEKHSSKSLMSNVMSIDEDIRWLVNGYNTSNSKSFHTLSKPYENCPLAYNRRQTGILYEARSELSEILKELRVITNKLRDDEANELEASDWQFAAMVVDRLCLYIFVLSTMVSTSAILLSAPNIFV